MESKPTALREAVAFFGLTLGLVYLVFWGPLALFHIPAISFVGNTMGPWWAVALYMVGGFTPSLVALFLTWRWEAGAGLRRLGRRVIQVDIGWRWYLAIVGIAALCVAGQILIFSLLGNSFDYSLFFTQLGSFVPLIVIGPLSEELGWRGYVLDRLEVRWSPLVSSLIVGVAWAFWHLPVFLIPGTSQNVLGIPFVGFGFGVVALSVLTTWMYDGTGRSIWTAVFFHWVGTYASQVASTGVAASRTSLYNWLEYTPFIIIALVVAALWNRSRASSSQLSRTEPRIRRPA